MRHDGSRAGLPVCSIDCLGDYCKVEGQPIILNRSSATTPYCAYCYMCGVLIRNPVACGMHEEGCPPWSFMATVHCRLVMAAMASISSNITDDMVQIATSIWLDAPYLHATDIAMAAIQQATKISDQDSC